MAATPDERPADWGTQEDSTGSAGRQQGDLPDEERRGNTSWSFAFLAPRGLETGCFRAFPSLIPAKAGIQVGAKNVDPRLTTAGVTCVSRYSPPVTAQVLVQNSLLITCPPLESLTGRPIGVSYSWVKSRPTRS